MKGRLTDEGGWRLECTLIQKVRDLTIEVQNRQTDGQALSPPQEGNSKENGGRDVRERNSGMSTGGIVHLHFKHKVS